VPLFLLFHSRQRKKRRVCNNHDDGSDNKSSHEEVNRGFTPYASVLIFDSKAITDSSVAQSSILPTLYIHIINVFRQSIESFLGLQSAPPSGLRCERHRRSATMRDIFMTRCLSKLA